MSQPNRIVYCFGFERLHAQRELRQQAWLCDLSYKSLSFIEEFSETDAKTSIDKALQESLLPLCADVSVKKGVDELVFIYLDKVEIMEGWKNII